MASYTVCVLLFGDYPQLADRCLRSIAAAIPESDLRLRVGMNAVVPAVADWVRSFVPEEDVFQKTENIGKYPLMREMFHGARPIDTEFIIWFDDDSYISPDYALRSRDERWLDLVTAAAVDADVMGSLYTKPWEGQQRTWVRKQPWYNGKPPEDRPHMRFATGGFWVARTEVLRKFDYPWPALKHNGGDTTLGELCFQQGLRLRQFKTGVHINANDRGEESKAARRGLIGQPPIGKHIDLDTAASVHGAR